MKVQLGTHPSALSAGASTLPVPAAAVLTERRSQASPPRASHCACLSLPRYCLPPHHRSPLALSTLRNLSPDSALLKPYPLPYPPLATLQMIPLHLKVWEASSNLWGGTQILYTLPISLSNPPRLPLPPHQQSSRKTSIPFSCGGLVAKLCLTIATPWTVACQVPLSMGFHRHKYWNGVAISFSRGPSQLKNQTQDSCIAGGLLHCRPILSQLSHEGGPISQAFFKVTP